MPASQESSNVEACSATKEGALGFIRVRGARQHNLKNIDVDIPRGQLVVMTGVSGSGKSSLAFDTLYAEGQRRYVQSLSAYARQFLEQLEKPDVDFIDGLSPAVAIEQKTVSHNPRSTIATITEIYDYLRILYANFGVPYDAETGQPLTKFLPAEIAQRILDHPEGTRILVLAPLESKSREEFRGLFDRLQREGFVRVRVNEKIVDLEESKDLKVQVSDQVELVVDRLVVKEGLRPRLMEAIQNALKWNAAEVKVWILGDPEVMETFPTQYRIEGLERGWDGFTPKHFSFNTPLGFCPVCQGTGQMLQADPHLLVPDVQLSLSKGAIKTWWNKLPKLKPILDAKLQDFLGAQKVDENVMFEKLPEAFKQALFFGDPALDFEGLCPQINRLHEESETETFRGQLSRWMNPHRCSVCEGMRLNPQVLSVKLLGSADLNTHKIALSIMEFCGLSVEKASDWIRNLNLPSHEKDIAVELQREVLKRLDFLREVGLGYLSLNRESGTLSGGESQRIRLATQIGAALSGVLYVLDEPSIGLHPNDTAKLIQTLFKLRDLGNSVIVVEHDEEMMRAADWLLELGLGAGPHGGEVMASGSYEEFTNRNGQRSLTAPYLRGEDSVQVMSRHLMARPRSDQAWLVVKGAREHNLKNLTVRFPLGCFTCVTGVSGSGKSTLVNHILCRALLKMFYQAKSEPGEHDSISGWQHLDKVIVIDQNPIGKSPRSNPATYVGAFAPIREVYAKLPAAKVRGYDASRFSFNVSGGRCEKCLGDGVLKIDMHFLSDVQVPCDQCEGRRYNSETLDIYFKGRNISDVLEMTVSQAITFFGKQPKIYEKLIALEKVGLGYIKLGQSGASLSGGEAQRVKLAAELAKKATGRTLYLLDEPTTGLHFEDVRVLLGVFQQLVDAGNSVIVVEHHLDVMCAADWIIDLGPKGGEEGGELVAEGTPEAVAKGSKSLTGQWLRNNLQR